MFINPVDISSNTYAFDPYDCGFNYMAGICAEVKLYFFTLLANAEEFVNGDFVSITFSELD